MSDKLKGENHFWLFELAVYLPNMPKEEINIFLHFT